MTRSPGSCWWRPSRRGWARVAVTIDTDLPPQKVLMVRGTARTEIVDGVPQEYLLGAKRVVGEDGMAEFEAQVRGLYDEMAMFFVTPEWAKVLDFAGGRMPKAVRELAEAKFSS